MSSSGHIIIRDAARQLRADAAAKTREAHGWLVAKLLQIKAVFWTKWT